MAYQAMFQQSLQLGSSTGQESLEAFECSGFGSIALEQPRKLRRLLGSDIYVWLKEDVASHKQLYFAPTRLGISGLESESTGPSSLSKQLLDYLDLGFEEIARQRGLWASLPANEVLLIEPSLVITAAGPKAPLRVLLQGQLRDGGTGELLGEWQQRGAQAQTGTLRRAGLQHQLEQWLSQAEQRLDRFASVNR